ncbi:MAG: VTT domain-containing protein [Lentisphaeria bacterium]|nr:VTT domain-containing protein [Lentisphaeria bacterium]
MKKVILIIVGMVVFFSVLFIVGEELGMTSRESIGRFIEHVHASPGGRSLVAGAVIGLLVVDILLPVPSSVVMILSGRLLGFSLGGSVSFAGALLAALLGFFGCRWGGQTVFTKLVGHRDGVKVKQWFEEYGVIAIILSRPVPMLTEILSCLAGLSKVNPATFISAAVLGTLPVCFVYSWFGAEGGPGLMAAVWVSIAIPAVGWVFTKWVKTRRQGVGSDSPK